MTRPEPTIVCFEDLRWLRRASGEGEFTYGQSPEEIERDNRRRAAFAAVALLAYVEVTGEDTLSTAVSDLLGDLRHLCDRLVEDNEDTNGTEAVNFEGRLGRSEVDYYAELQGLP